MRCAPASQFKNSRRNVRHLNDAPREGTKLRAIYDLLQSRRGQPVECRLGPNGMVFLTDFYGLDIRRIQNGSCRTGRKSIYVLAGEWFGRVYVDYIAEHLASQERAT